MNLNQRQREILKQMGVQTWSLRASSLENDVGEIQAEERPDEQVSIAGQTVETVVTDTAASTIAEATHVESIQQDQWVNEKFLLAECVACQQNATATLEDKVTQADWMIIGESSAADEEAREDDDDHAERVNQLLNNMIKAMGLSPEKVYYANVHKSAETSALHEQEHRICCDSFLRQQLQLTRAKIILVMGKQAAQSLLKVDTPIGKMRGQKYLLMGTKIPVVVTYHPAYLLRSPREKRKSWQDLCDAMDIYKQLS